MFSISSYDPIRSLSFVQEPVLQSLVASRARARVFIKFHNSVQHEQIQLHMFASFRTVKPKSKLFVGRVHARVFCQTV